MGAFVIKRFDEFEQPIFELVVPDMPVRPSAFMDRLNSKSKFQIEGYELVSIKSGFGVQNAVLFQCKGESDMCTEATLLMEYNMEVYDMICYS
ncbi:MAG: hypothetical protein J6C57_06035 [Paludibacteraceae bacterium]|nr:hypothetical protein [Paludibacteraceae bacterium]